ncbi:MAG: aminoglycoside phosphotransferase family protein [Anaerolineales bacterium]|nr:MAG: aminoglycoside phosphotransferase family protein [Anaerolineales bacterium]
MDFVSTIKNTFGEDGEKFIAELPELVEEASQRWGLTNVQPVANLSFNFVAFGESSQFTAKRAKSAKKGLNLRALRGPSGLEKWGDVVLKIGVPRDELTSEMAALKLFNGEGACRLIDCDEEKGFLLLERLQPGAMLAEMEDDEEATRIAAEVMKRVWRAGFDTPSAGASGYSSSDSKFIQLSDWFDGLKRLRKMFKGKTGPLEAKLVERVERSTKDFFAENHRPVLMHGDFHHYNVLSSERGWLAIDPKGVIGPACYEVGPLMMNPWGESPTMTSLNVRVKKRVDILREYLGFERERILEWSLAHAVLSAWWGIEDNTGWEYSLAFAKMIASL